MRLLLYTAPTPAEDLAFEEALQLGLEAGRSPPTWRLWEARSPALILGTGQEHAREVNMEAAQRGGVPVLRRHSGGGAVLIGPGVLCYSGFYRLDELPGSETIAGAFAAGLRPVLKTLKKLGVDAQPAGLSDLVVRAAGGELKKIAGNSQARKRRSVLLHGTLLAAPDWAALERCLKFPSRAPDYRAGRDHRAFLTSLSERKAPVDLAAFSETFREVLETEDPPAREALPAERAASEKLYRAKYARDAWNLRR